MSLFNEIASSLAQSTGIGGALSSLNAQINAFTGMNPATAAMAAQARGMASTAVAQLANKYTPAVVKRMDATMGASGYGGLLGGGTNSGNVLDAMGVTTYSAVNGLSSVNSQAPGAISIRGFDGNPNPLFGGISMAEARQIYQEAQSTRFAKKNLFLIDVSSRLKGSISNFNLFVTDIEYAPFTITGEKRRVGSSVLDSVQSGEPVELRITTMDDQAGTLKNWFQAHCMAAVALDGTVGLPEQYAIKIVITHAFIKPASGAYTDTGLYRPANIEFSLSRREDALQEIQMSFSQLDTFMAP
ncbi:hypothetical protein F6R98_10665 [Candidatus Methylospira mobilis]|uniref:Phage tail protein n=1 Tax=Candidatus Methylospira mobilis TaxID=1808979 RepID=A0A5Q0BGT2_9GAMM|nr:hypothetical protein [Candidatus Methylospira mobilis]QFY43020.1 hypothetical protein F6R98_10665 [Candidatus Methylospira mobilis]